MTALTFPELSSTSQFRTTESARSSTCTHTLFSPPNVPPFPQLAFTHAAAHLDTCRVASGRPSRSSDSSLLDRQIFDLDSAAASRPPGPGAAHRSPPCLVHAARAAASSSAAAALAAATPRSRDCTWTTWPGPNQSGSARAAAGGRAVLGREDTADGRPAAGCHARRRTAR